MAIVHVDMCSFVRNSLKRMHIYVLRPNLSTQTRTSRALPPIVSSKCKSLQCDVLASTCAHLQWCSVCISVLVSNKTIRNQISTKKQLLKQESIPDIKRYLVKHGFIKVGSITPNDILRKMYESALLICGEVTNHNPDNLLYNFMNVKE